jgi:hypothetical protein
MWMIGAASDDWVGRAARYPRFAGLFPHGPPPSEVDRQRSARGTGPFPSVSSRTRRASPAGVLKICRELLAERGGVRGVQVDLIVGALEGEPRRLLCRAAGQIVFENYGYLLGDLYQ